MSAKRGAGRTGSLAAQEPEDLDAPTLQADDEVDGPRVLFDRELATILDREPSPTRGAVHQERRPEPPEERLGGVLVAASNRQGEPGGPRRKRIRGPPGGRL